MRKIGWTLLEVYVCRGGGRLVCMMGQGVKMNAAVKASVIPIRRVLSITEGV